MNAIAQISDRECLIAHFSEIAAETARLCLSGASIDCSINVHGLTLSINAPFVTGPVACMNFYLGRLFSDQSVMPSVVFHDTYANYRPRMLTRRYQIWPDAPLSKAEPLIEQIFRHLARIEKNIDACTVYERVA